MKKNFITKFALVVVFATMTIPAMSQKIIYDNVDSETGIRTVGTDDVNCRNLKDKIGLFVSLRASILRNDTIVMLCMNLRNTTPLSVNEDSRMLIRLGDDSVLEFKAMNGDEDSIGDITDVGLGATLIVYNIYPLYRVTKEELLEMAIKGVKKVRIESAPDYYDKEFQKDKVGAAIKKLYPVLKKDIETPKSFDADF